MDTRFWGPSGWQLFHLIAFRSEHPDDVLNQMKDVLPCRFCRESTAQFVRDSPLRGDPGRWLYELHNKVNDKLRKQCADDPAVINPGPDPSFEEVKRKYLRMKPTHIPGRDFLMSIAYNFPETPEPQDMSVQREFLHALAKVYPFASLRVVVAKYVRDHEPDLESRKTYTRWMYGLLTHLAKATHTPLRSYSGYMQHVAYYKSGCAKKTYRGKTCRRTQSGGFTKTRNPATTRRVTTAGLLPSI